MNIQIELTEGTIVDMEEFKSFVDEERLQGITSEIVQTENIDGAMGAEFTEILSVVLNASLLTVVAHGFFSCLKTFIKEIWGKEVKIRIDDMEYTGDPDSIEELIEKLMEILKKHKNEVI